MADHVGAVTRAVAKVVGMPSRAPRLAMAFGVRAVKRTAKGRCRVYLRPSLDLGAVFMAVAEHQRSLLTVRTVVRREEGVQRVYAVDVETFSPGEAPSTSKVAKRIDCNFHLQGLTL